jgi:hypothetical protein
MAFITATKQCDHGVKDDVCWRCSFEFMEKRWERLYDHMGFIARGCGGGTVSPVNVAQRALDEDDLFDGCVRGEHTRIDVTSYFDPDPVFTPCQYCGAK